MMKRRIILVIAVLLGAVPLLAIPLTGRVVVKGRAPNTNLPTIVYAESLDGGARPQARRFTLRQEKKSFHPRFQVIPVGSTVDFPNEDSVFHNVFSLNPPERFDLGLYRAGASKSQTFKEPGEYRVFCNIHPQMSAVILVVPTSNYVEADASGNYRLDVPAGRYRLTAWSERSEPVSAEVTVGAGTTTFPELTLDESRAVKGPHTNKFGQAYPKAHPGGVNGK
jgi:plastocyanin